VLSGCALIEIHNHGGDYPRFSRTDRAGFRDIVPYMLDSLRGRPYVATVWGDDTVYGEYFAPDGRNGIVTSVVVVGSKLDQVVSLNDDEQPIAQRFDRQAPWFSDRGQRRLGRLTFGFIGVGGTGSQAVQNLVYLGGRRFILVEHDDSDETSMNRLVTATAADVGTSKAVLARRLIKAVAPDAQVEMLGRHLQAPGVLGRLKAADVLIGCVDNDGARLILNEFALAYGIPYFDLGVGIDVEYGRVTAAGGRLAVVLPGGPCMYCMNQIDPDEARYWLSTEAQREFMRRNGYVTGVTVRAPSVVALNASLAAAAINELAVYVSGLRPVSPLAEYDLLGAGRAVKGQWSTPVRVERRTGCPVCENAGAGDETDCEGRFTISEGPASETG
jgi:molybdopterin/thiamine biosynthesis adenylyltransferase